MTRETEHYKIKNIKNKNIFPYRPAPLSKSKAEKREWRNGQGRREVKVNVNGISLADTCRPEGRLILTRPDSAIS